MDDDDDDYVVFGTPLPDFDDFNLKKKQAADLVVRDDQGRQRFHGAFTGGFSAGYFNTVGSKEGWTPSNYVSSRSQKAGSLRQNPEDFMDDEDFSVFGIAPKTVQTTSDFRDSSSDSGRKRKRVDDSDAIIPGEPPLKELVRPVRESIGIKILKKMGWRHGQGIGPKIKKDTGIKIYGCSLGPLTTQDKKTTIDLDDLEFAPSETPEVMYVPKDDYHGIGYSGLSTESILNASGHFSASATKTWLPKEQRKLNISGQAFGVGALEDDDEDIYGREDMSQYDFSELLGPSSSDNSTPSAKRGEAHHTVGVLEGFCPSTKPSGAKKQYPLPEIPRDYVPVHLKKKVNRESSSEIARQKLNPAARSLLLGEKAHVNRDTASPKVHGDKLRSRFCPAPEEETPLFPPGLVGSLNSKPFAHDSEKQARYERFLQTGCNKDELYSIQPSWMTEWQKQQESDEFFKTASLMKPFSGSLNSRFESRSQLAMDVPPKVISKKPENDSSSGTDHRTKQKPTREVFEWHPASLLCKRFNVPNPYPESDFQGTPGSENRTKRSLFDSMLFEEPDSQVQVSPGIIRSEKKEEDLPVTTSQPKEIEVQGETSQKDGGSENGNNAADTTQGIVQEIQKPPMDLFRDIFKSSSSEESDTEESGKPNETSKETDVKISKSDDSPIVKLTPKVTSDAKTVKKPAFGVFANIDLDALSRRTPSTSLATNASQNTVSNDTLSDNVESSANGESSVCDSLNQSTSSDVYGPELPPGIIGETSHFVHHKHSKHKHHKHKVKKKKKKKKKRHSGKIDSSSSSGDDSEEDVPPAVLIEKLKKLQKLEKHKRR